MTLWSIWSIRIAPLEINHVLIHALKHIFQDRLLLNNLLYSHCFAFLLFYNMSGILVFLLSIKALLNCFVNHSIALGLLQLRKISLRKSYFN